MARVVVFFLDGGDDLLDLLLALDGIRLGDEAASVVPEKPLARRLYALICIFCCHRGIKISE